MRFSPKAWSNEVQFAAVGFLATLCVAGYAIDSGAADAGLHFLQRTVETEVVLLFAPLCALVLAMLVEVARFATGETLPEPPRRRQVVDWQPAQGED